MVNRDCLLAYFAGAIDADGFITIQRSHRRVGERYERFSFVPTYYAAKVGFTGTADPVVQGLLKELFDGSVFKHQPSDPNHKMWVSWQATNKKAMAACEALLPFLLTKRKQAELIIKFCRLTDRQWAEIKNTQIPPYRVTPEMEAERHSFWHQVTLLNAPRNRRIHKTGTDAGEIFPATQ